MSHSQSGYGVLLENGLFLATSENLNWTSLLQITQNPQLDNMESYFHAIFIGKHCFYRIFLVSSCTSLVLSFALFQ